MRRTLPRCQCAVEPCGGKEHGRTIIHAKQPCGGKTEYAELFLVAIVDNGRPIYVAWFCFDKIDCTRLLQEFVVLTQLRGSDN